MKQSYKSISAIFIIVILGLIFQKEYINEFPSYIHAWAQSDRYAIALRFTENKLNFFKPETFVYNHQFPNDMKIPSNETITAVDFPIHDYIPAVLMKLMRNKSPWIFRLYLLLYSFAGLFFLFRIAFILTNDFIKSLLITILAATSPVFVYYQAGFLPTIPSLSNSFIGIYFYARYLQSKRDRHFNLALLFVTLAALSRTTFAIPLIAILCYEFIRLIKKETNLRSKIIPVMFSAGSLLLFFFYNGYLREKYGSVFLNYFMPATSFSRIIEILKTVKENWGTQYFSMIHYIVFLVLITLFVISLLLKNVKYNRISKEILQLTIIILIGCVLFALLMIRQFPAHDYYFLDTFFLPVIILFTIILSVIPSLKSKAIGGIIPAIILIATIFLVKNAVDTQKSRRILNPSDRTASTINNFSGSLNFLDSLDVPQNAKILVIGSYAPNIPFILMNRKGYAVMSLKRENIINALTWDFDFIVMQKEFFLSDIYSSYPEILSKVEKIRDNNKILVCKLAPNEIHQEIDEFLGLSNQIPLREEQIDFDTISTVDWKNISSTSEKFHSGNSSGLLTKNMEFGITFSTNELPELKNAERLLLFQSWFLHDSIDDVKLVVTVSEDNHNIYYITADLQDFLNKQNEWEKISLTFKLPVVKSNNYEFAIYLWNVKRSKLYFDDFGFKIY